MKTCSLVLALWACTFSTGAQTPADYFLPLCTGNYIQLHNDDYGTYLARTTYYRVLYDELVNGDTYYLHKGYSIEDVNPGDTQVFQCIWLQRATDGQIMLGAIDFTNSGNLDSAVLFDPPLPYFSTEMLTAGYSRYYTVYGNVSRHDTVISTTATVGSFTNCIQVRTTRFDNIAPALIEDFYYAPDKGYVKIERLFPNDQTHVRNFIGNRTVNCYLGIEDTKDKDALRVYPNPAQASITVEGNFETGPQTRFELHDALGKPCMQIPLTSAQQTIPIDLPEGLYVYTLHDKSGYIKQGKLLVR